MTTIARTVIPASRSAGRASASFQNRRGDDAVRGGGRRGRRGPGEVGHQPPRAVVPDHPREQPQAAAQTHQGQVLVGGAAAPDVPRRRHELPQPVEDPLRGIGLLRRAARDQVPDQVDDQPGHPAAQPQGTERGQRHHRHAVVGVVVRRDRDRAGPPRQVGDQHQQVPAVFGPALLRQVQHGNVTLLVQRKGLRLVLDVPGRLFAEVAGQAIGQPFRDSPGELLGKSVIGQQAHHKGLRRALGSHARAFPRFPRCDLRVPGSTTGKRPGRALRSGSPGTDVP
ncbi:hypothetical protein [Amycolatopsis sp. DG1A-15b]|uniref:hypothetical protein n=1 Tax=Amycolatopsis sp. DG1A-15b TaxID=3052846 RepID=UPI00255C19C4|nr:hypothetical protein [Amycolatopsis sp. DG1A-15b]WIX92184.1 hypothetical protein QRY02_17735 [Amycolatopsis sp. DG1A-15b]